MRYFVVSLCTLILHILCANALYEGYRLVRIFPRGANETKAIQALEHRGSPHYDIWSIDRSTERPVSMMVSPEGWNNLSRILNRFNMTSEVLIENLKTEIDRQAREKNSQLRLQMFRTKVKSEHDTYRTVEEIEAAVDRYARKHPFVQIEVLGYTAENRPVRALKISKDSSKPIIWIDAGIHAREWIAPAATLYFVDRLLTRGGQAFLKDFQFFIVPLVNPDGYHYTHQADRLWRKNRSPTAGEHCVGVDLNRNFPLKWGYGDGTSPRACDDIYRGDGPASELESQALINKLTELKDQIVLYLNLHSFGQFILTPYGFARYRYPGNYNNMINLGELVQKEIQKRYNYVYRVGSASDLLYEASGGAEDFVAGVLNVPYAYTIELCDEGRYGFLLPPAYIRTVGRQLWTAVKVFAYNI
ncbi:carboxypeptidase O [Clonorchis sinensis]|uniref:Carboxypeptidase O n=1 Tax=Clonorchis sinensis TaxID=79923 RepID=H2KUJ3_CLOSI|nr:carboxypeptidase O [Clonorchis sinensis]